MTLPDAAVVAVVTGAVGLVSTGITHLASSIRRRNRDAQAVNDAKTDVEFWQQWLKAQELAQTPDGLERVREIARIELDRVHQAVIARKQDVVAASPADAIGGVTARPWFKRTFLLYQPARGAAWVPRLSFWAILAVCVVGVIGAYASPDEGEPPIVSAGWAALGAGVFFLAFGLPLRAWSLWLDRSRPSRIPARRSRPESRTP